MNAFLEKVILILLLLWAMWITHEVGIKLEDATVAIKLFNANIGPALPPIDRKKPSGN